MIVACDRTKYILCVESAVDVAVLEE